VGARDVNSLFVGALADITNVEAVATGIGPEIVAIPGLLTVEKIGIGEPVVTLTEFDNVPNASNDHSSYVDIHLTNATDVESLKVILAYVDDINEGNHTLFWKNDGIWYEVSPAQDVVVDTVNNTVQFTFTESTTPSLSQLTGTPFVVGSGGTVPTAIVVSQFVVQPFAQKSMLMLAVIIAVIASIAFGVLAFHKRGLSSK
jgi:hypothetical protein